MTAVRLLKMVQCSMVTVNDSCEVVENGAVLYGDSK